MSESFLANLPRFDRGDHDCTVSLSEPGTLMDAEEISAPAEANSALQEQMQAVEQTLASLASITEQLQQEIRQRAESQMTALAEKLFPKLGQSFLAEEIARPLPDLLPASVADVEIRAEPELAAALTALIDGSSQLAGCCSVIEDEAPGANRATISWRDGGVDFDFEGLLEACLGRLKAT